MAMITNRRSITLGLICAAFSFVAFTEPYGAHAANREHFAKLITKTSEAVDYILDRLAADVRRLEVYHHVDLKDTRLGIAAARLSTSHRRLAVSQIQLQRLADKRNLTRDDQLRFETICGSVEVELQEIGSAFGTVLGARSDTMSKVIDLLRRYNRSAAQPRCR